MNPTPYMLVNGSQWLWVVPPCPVRLWYRMQLHYHHNIMSNFKYNLKAKSCFQCHLPIDVYWSQYWLQPHSQPCARSNESPSQCQWYFPITSRWSPIAATPRPILVKFTSYRSRERIYKARQIGAAFDISTNEDLTQVTAYLAYNAREVKRPGLLVDTRTMDRKVFVRMPAEERSTIVGDLDELEKYLHRQNERPHPAS